MHSRNEYPKVLRESYLKAKANKEKSDILYEYCGETGQSKKHVIRETQSWVDPRPKQRKKRMEAYDNQIKGVLARVWEIFDCCCGQKPKPVPVVEMDGE